MNPYKLLMLYQCISLDHHKTLIILDLYPFCLSSKKLLTELCIKRLYSFLLEQNIFGFQKNKSAFHSLIEIVENIRSSIENKKYGRGIFIDLKRLLTLSIITYCY